MFWNRRPRDPDTEPWLFPELDRSFKQIFLLQMVFVLFGIGIAWSVFGRLVGAVLLVITGLVWCGMIQVAISNARTRQNSLRTAEELAKQRQIFHVTEGRLLDRGQMTAPPVLDQPDNLELPGPDGYGNG